MFQLDSVQVKLDDKVVANYLYTRARGRGAAPRRRPARLSRQPEERQARAGRVLHRQGAARARLPARRQRQVREDQRSEVHRASHPGLGRQAPTRVRRQALAVTSHDSRFPRSPRASHRPRSRCGGGVRRCRPHGRARGLAVRRRARPAEPTHEIKAPHYGDALYYFFQDRYFTSITTLMASQQFDRVVKHDDEAEILRGGMLASYGMTKEAGEIFATADRPRRAPPVRDRAWFYLAKIRYQRGYLPEAEESLAKIERKLPPQLEEERGLLLAQLLMLRSDYAGAAGALSGLPLKGTGARYVRYNLGIALLQVGRVEARHAAARRHRQGVGADRGVPEPARPRQRRARLLGALGEPAQGRAHLPRAGSPAEPAVEQGAARLRLGRRRARRIRSSRSCRGRSWRTRDFGETAVLEAQIAVPYAYAEARRLRPGAAALRERRSPRYERESAELERVDQGDPRRQDDRHAGRAEPRRGDGLVLEDPRPRRDAARAPPRAGARPARVPGSAEELPRPALPRAQPRGVAREARSSSRTCWRRGARRSPIGCRSCASASSRSTSRRSSSGARPSSPRSPPARRPATASPSPTPSSSSCSSA